MLILSVTSVMRQELPALPKSCMPAAVLTCFVQQQCCQLLQCGVYAAHACRLCIIKVVWVECSHPRPSSYFDRCDKAGSQHDISPYNTNENMMVLESWWLHFTYATLLIHTEHAQADVTMPPWTQPPTCSHQGWHSVPCREGKACFCNHIQGLGFHSFHKHNYWDQKLRYNQYGEA